MASTAAVPSNHKTVNRRRQTTPDSTPDSTRTRQESPTTSRPEVGEEEASIETSSQESEWWQVKKIIAERAGKYQILWEGIDPKTKKPWPLEWVKKRDVTAALVAEWEEKKGVKRSTRQKSKSAEKQSPIPSPSKQNKRRNIASTRKNEEQEEIPLRFKRIRLVVKGPPEKEQSTPYQTQTSEYEPSQATPTPSFRPRIKLRVNQNPPTQPNRQKRQSEEIIDDSYEQLPPPDLDHTEDIAIEISQKTLRDKDDYIPFSDNSSSQVVSQSQVANPIRSSPPQISLDCHKNPSVIIQAKHSSIRYLGKGIVPDSQGSTSGFEDSLATNRSADSAVQQDPVSTERSEQQSNHSPGTSKPITTQKKDAEVVPEYQQESPYGSGSWGGRPLTHRTFIDSQSFQDGQIISPIQPVEYSFSEERSLFRSHESLESPLSEGEAHQEPESRTQNPQDTQQTLISVPPSIGTHIDRREQHSCHIESSFSSQPAAQVVSQIRPYESQASSIASSSFHSQPSALQHLPEGRVSQDSIGKETSPDPVIPRSDWLVRRGSPTLNPSGTPGGSIESFEGSILPLPPRSPSPYFDLHSTIIPVPPSSSPMSERQNMSASTSAAAPSTPSNRQQSLLERLAASRRAFQDGLSTTFQSPGATRSFSSTANSPTPGSAISNATPSSDTHAQLFPAVFLPKPIHDIPGGLDMTPKKLPPRAQTLLSPFASHLQESLSSLSEIPQNINFSQATLSQLDSFHSIKQIPNLDVGEYAIALPLGTGQMEAYLQNIRNNACIIQDYCGDITKTQPEAITTIEAILDRAGRIATHLDLISDEPLDFTAVSEQQEAEYALLHPKFVFLKELFESLRNQNIQVAILARAGKTLDLLEVFLRAIRIRSNRLDGFSSLPRSHFNAIDGSVTVLLAPTGEEGSRILAKNATLVIAMDVTFDVNDPQVEMFRAHTIEVGRRAPVLRLISYNTVEHVKLYISRKEDPNLIQLMSYVAILRQNTGAVSVEYSKKIGEAAASITNSITSDSHTLSLPRLPGIPNYDGQSQATQDPTVSQAPPSSQSSSPKPVPANLVQPNVLGIQHAGEKRTFSELNGHQPGKTIAYPSVREAPSKRQRTEDEPTLSNDAPSVNPADITHVTDSMPNQTQPPVVHRPIKNKESNEKYQNEQPSVPQVPEGLEEIMTDAPNEITNNAMLPATAHVEPSASEPGAQQPAPALGNTIPEIQEVSAQTAPEDQTMGSPPRIVDGSQPAIDASNDGDIEMNDVGNDAGNDEIPPKPEDTVFIPWEADLKNIASQSQLEDLSREEIIEVFKERSNQLNEWIRTTSNQQLRYEQLRKEHRDLRVELSKVKESFASVEETKERLAQEVWKMEDERRQLRIELKEARSALLGSDKPDVARMEELRTKNEKLEETIAGKERELKEKTTELELFRELRQTATAAAVEARRETAELQKANEVLQRKADERVIRLREMQFDAQSKLKDQQISKLESQLALKKEALRKLELKLASTKGRPLGTRTVSVPQRASPGQSRTSSPGPTTLPPLTGRDLPTHPLRNNHG